MALNLHAFDVPAYEKLIEPRIKELMEKGESTFESAHLRKDGSIMQVEVHACISDVGGRKVVISVTRDITERKQAEELLTLSTIRTQVLLDLHLISNSPKEQLLDFTLGKSLLITQSKVAFVGLMDEAEEVMTIHRWSKEAMDQCLMDNKPIFYPITSAGWWGDCIRNRKPVMVNDYTIQHPAKKGIPEGHMLIRRFLSVPIFDAEHIVAVAAVANKQIDYNDADIESLTSLVNKLWESLRRKQAEEELRESGFRYKTLFSEALDGICIADADTGVIIDCNKALEALVGRDRVELIGQHQSILHLPAGDKKGFSPTFEQHLDDKHGQVLQTQVVTKTGEIREVEIKANLLNLPEGKVLQGIFSDITERKQAVEALRVSEAELHDNYFAQATINMILSESLENAPLEVILQKALNMILSVPWIAFEPIGSIHLIEDDPEILVMKAQYNFPESQIRLCAHIPFGKCLCGRAAQSRKIEFADHIDERHEICYEGMSPHGHYIVPIQSGGRTLGVLNVYLKEGHIRNQNEEEFLRTIADALAGIIMRKQAEVRIEYLAYYDDLTGLPNRNLFIDRLTQGIARIEYSKKLVAVLTIDIDKFKFINDSYGIEAGDAVLKAVAKKLTISVREGDTVARIGGDDFLVLLIDIAQSEDIILIVEKIMKNASQAIHLEGKEVVLTVSVGISVHPNDGQDASVLIKNAEIALARAKQQGRKSYQFYTEGMDIKASEFVQMEKDLFNAIKNEEFILHYQPVWDINTKKTTGMEALIRWKSPELGLVSPGKFIHVLEDTRMIIEVGEWVLRTAVRQVQEWQDKGYPVVPVSVNLSPIQFRQKDIAMMIEKIIRETGFNPSLLTLEITESAFMQDMEFTHSVLQNLRNIGVSISIDDFGTGYSSLAHLRKFPIDNLKIDMSFIREIATDTDTASIVTAIINMAHTLNLKTIAEGIETEEQWKMLRLLRCDMGQGFYLSKPLPAEEMAIFIISQG
jgi:diguanylate cyclase (GGDEF)-like protein/PAS domain S-box-containing protein